MPRKVVVLFFLQLFLVTTLLAQQENEQINRYLEQARTVRGTPGISYAVALEGKLVYSGGVGYADLNNMVPATAATVHNVGSVSKVNVVVAVMQLVEQGTVDLDAPIQTYVPSFPRKRWPVTLRHVMTHTPGIRHYNPDDFGNEGAENKNPFESFEEGLAIFKDDPLLFEPGSYWSYSSYATNLFRGVVETVTGQELEKYMRIHVWQPAGMLSTAFDVPSRIVKHRARGYRRDDAGTLIQEPYGDMSYKYPGGGVISTAEDLVRLCLALCSCRTITRRPGSNDRMSLRMIREGFFADIVVFDPATIRDKATFVQPYQYSEGIDLVLTDGTPVVDEGELTWALPGRVITPETSRVAPAAR